MKVSPDCLLQVGVIAPSTMSLAVGATKVTTAPFAPVASTALGVGTVIEGGVVSTTVIVRLLEPILPALSVAVHITRVGPSGKIRYLRQRL